MSHFVLKNSLQIYRVKICSLLITNTIKEFKTLQRKKFTNIQHQLGTKGPNVVNTFISIKNEFSINFKRKYITRKINNKTPSRYNIRATPKTPRGANSLQ